MTAKAPELLSDIRQAINSQDQATVTILSSLLAVEDKLGYIPDEAISEIAKFNKSTDNDVWGVASFYTNFRFTPPGKHILEICWGPTCHIAGSMEIVSAALEELNLTTEGDTDDGEFTLKYNTCLGACSQACAISIDGEIIGKATPENLINYLNI